MKKIETEKPYMRLQNKEEPETTIWCSMLRNGPVWAENCFLSELQFTNKSPNEGDLVAVEVLSHKGAYNGIENADGTETQLKQGDRFVGVLGSRFSGRNPCGILPPQGISRGNRLSLLSIGGVIGVETHTPRYYGSNCLPISVLGFPQLKNNGLGVTNLKDVQAISDSGSMPTQNVRMTIVCGTSAECGKTTLVGHIIQEIRKSSPEHSIVCCKITGTGRLRDLNSYRRAGAAHVLDFVDFGWPTTYNRSPQEMMVMVQSISEHAATLGTIVIFEIGGDLLEGGAGTILQFGSKNKIPFFLCVNDALGAMASTAKIKDCGGIIAGVTSYRQNLWAIERRIKDPVVFDSEDLIELRSSISRANLC